MINFWRWSNFGHWFRINFPFPSPLRNRRCISISHAVTGRFLRYLVNDWRRQENESNTFSERSGRHRDPEIRIRIPDQILALAESALSECSCWNCSHFPSFEPPPECISHRLRPASPVSSCLAPPSDLLDRRKQSVGRKCAEATPSGVQHHIVWTSQSITK